MVAENMARKLFAFGVGSEKFPRQNEKIPVPLLETFARRLVCILLVNSLYNRELFRIFEY